MKVYIVSRVYGQPLQNVIVGVFGSAKAVDAFIKNEPSRPEYYFSVQRWDVQK